jgi:hypothetical protein
VLAEHEAVLLVDAVVLPEHDIVLAGARHRLGRSTTSSWPEHEVVLAEHPSCCPSAMSSWGEDDIVLPVHEIVLAEDDVVLPERDLILAEEDLGLPRTMPRAGGTTPERGRR